MAKKTYQRKQKSKRYAKKAAYKPRSKKGPKVFSKSQLAQYVQLATARRVEEE